MAKKTNAEDKEIEKIIEDNSDELVENQEGNEVTKEEPNSQEIKEDDKTKVLVRVGKKESSVAKFKEKFKNKKLRLALIITAITLIVIIVSFSTIACINKFNSKVYKNVCLFGENIGGKTREQVIEIINKHGEDVLKAKTDIYQGTDNLLVVTSDEIELKVDAAATVTNVMGFGRDNNLFSDNLKILGALFKPVNIEPVYSYNEEKLDGVIKNIDLTIKNRANDDSYSIDEGNKKLIITKGKSGNSIDYSNEKENILNALKNNEEKLTLNIINRKPNILDVEKVYSEVRRDAKDAYVDEEASPIKFYSEIVGIDFNVEELKAFLEKEENKEEGKVLEFDLTITEPKVKLSDLTSKYYNDKLAGKTTYFPASQVARSNNLRIALEYMNGKIIMPGEVFSYNDTIGDTTAAKGYRPAATFKGGTTVDEMGGGICQTVSTLYDVALMANLEIVERHQHGLPVGYVLPSLDATVYSPMLDFKFKNTRKYPIKIVTSYSNAGSLNVSIYGTKEEVEYEIVLTSKTLSSINYTTKYIYDNNMPDGEQVIVSNGANGYVSEGYLTRYLNGVYVDSRVLSRDTYNAQQQVVKVGTAQAAS